MLLIEYAIELIIITHKLNNRDNGQHLQNTVSHIRKKEDGISVKTERTYPPSFI